MMMKCLNNIETLARLSMLKYAKQHLQFHTSMNCSLINLDMNSGIELKIKRRFFVLPENGIFI